MELLCLRSILLGPRVLSPAELLYGRKVRSNLPAKDEIRQSVSDHHNWLSDNAKRSSQYYDQNAGPELPGLLPGLKVLMQEPGMGSWNCKISV